MVSRSFGAPVTRGVELAEAVTQFASRGAEKLRAKEAAAGALVVFIATSPFRKQDLSIRVRSRCLWSGRRPTPACWSLRHSQACARSTDAACGTPRLA